VLVYRTKDKGTRRVQGYVCAVWENGEPMRTKSTPTTNTHEDWFRHVAVIDGAARKSQSSSVLGKRMLIQGTAERRSVSAASTSKFFSTSCRKAKVVYSSIRCRAKQWKFRPFESVSCPLSNRVGLHQDTVSSGLFHFRRGNRTPSVSKGLHRPRGRKDRTSV
jgi:hypothetical protein